MAREQATLAKIRGIWFALLGLTLVEVALAAAGARGGVMLAILLTASMIKSWLILGWFMHLRFERRTLAWTVLPIAIVCMLLLCFILPDSVRLGRLRAPDATDATRASSTK
jgi:caa(3)-type oxidase subunit IV